MKLEILMSCMHQKDGFLIEKSGITGDAVIINQCDREEFCSFSTANGSARMYSTTQRGLTKSRNMAIEKARADFCLLCDDDEKLVPDYAEKVAHIYEQLPCADIVIFKMVNRKPSFPDRVMRLRFPLIMKVSSWQMSFRRDALLKAGVRFDELLGAGTGNGAEEELKFLLDCQKAGLKIYYVPVEIASVSHDGSTWFQGFDETFFYNRGATTRYILGYPIAAAYAIYYVIRKRSLYIKRITSMQALKAIFRGIHDNKIQKMARTKASSDKGEMVI